MTNLSSRLASQLKLEKELTREVASIIRPGAPMYVVDWFVFGAVQRTLAQSRGFRSMIETRNFPSAAILLRTQVDTAMRLNGLRYLDSPEEQLFELFKGLKTFRQLLSWQKTEKDKSIFMQDWRLKEWLHEDEPWIKKVYEETSDFVHLSFRPLFACMRNLDDKGNVSFAITGEDNVENETAYYEICDAFCDTSRLISTLVMEVLIARHERDPLR